MAPTPQEIQRARDNFVAWLEWIRATYEDRFPTDGALAAAIGISPGGYTQLTEAGSTRTPKLKTLMGARSILENVTIDQLLGPPPKRRP